MTRKLTFTAFTLLMFFTGIRAQVIQVGLFTGVQLKRIVVIAERGNYTVTGDGVRITELLQSKGLRLEIRNNKIGIKSLESDFGSYAKVELRASTSPAILNVKGMVPETPANPYNDNFKFEISKGHIRIVNQVYIENYVAGVVEAESGKDRPTEYYKVQSIITRTYALTNFRRHIAEGFQLCDGVHCQVYNGRSRFVDAIPEAVKETRGMVLVDSDIELITAAFSSNCGGKTRNSEEVWSKALPYLVSVADTFCLNGDHARWEKSVSRHEWEKYKMKNPYGTAIKNGKGGLLDDTFSEFLYGKQDLNAIRKYFILNSTRFVIEEGPDSVRFSGQGFGHGVGLCQEGAIRMAELGYSYREILEYYYTGVHLIQLSTLNFFKWD